MSGSKAELLRKKDVYEAILKGMALDNPDRKSYQADLDKIKDELEASETPASQPEKSGEEQDERSEGRSVSVETEVLSQTEELYLPPAKEEETAPATESQDKVKETEKVPEGEATLKVASNKALVRELVNRFVNFMKQ